MNIQLGLTRLLTVAWGLIGLVGVFFLGEILLTAINRGRLDIEAMFLSIAIVVASYIGWRISLWVLNGFFGVDLPKRVESSKSVKPAELPDGTPQKGTEYLKVGGFAIAVLVVGGVVTPYAEIIGAGILYIGLIAALLMAVRVFKGGKAFD
jgi:hypothetical protein